MDGFMNTPGRTFMANSAGDTGKTDKSCCGRIFYRRKKSCKCDCKKKRAKNGNGNSGNQPDTMLDHFSAFSGKCLQSPGLADNNGNDHTGDGQCHTQGDKSRQYQAECQSVHGKAEQHDHHHCRAWDKANGQGPGDKAFPGYFRFLCTGAG